MSDLVKDLLLAVGGGGAFAALTFVWKFRQERAAARRAELEVRGMEGVMPMNAEAAKVATFQQMATNYLELGRQFTEALARIAGLEIRIDKVEDAERDCLKREALKVAELASEREARKAMEGQVDELKAKVDELDKNQRARMASEVLRAVVDSGQGGE